MVFVQARLSVKVLRFLIYHRAAIRNSKGLEISEITYYLCSKEQRQDRKMQRLLSCTFVIFAYCIHKFFGNLAHIKVKNDNLNFWKSNSSQNITSEINHGMKTCPYRLLAINE